MSAQQNRPNRRGGRGRGGHPGQNRGGYSGPRRGGPQGNAPIPAQQQGQQYQPTFPTPHSAFNASPPYHVPPPSNPAGLPPTPAKTVREETTTTYTEGGKTVTTVRTVVNEVGHAPEYGHQHQPFTPNSQFHVNTPQPSYQGEYQNTNPPQQATGKQRPPMSQPMPQNPPYNERPVSGRPQGSRGPPMSQPMPQHPPYNERPVSGRPQGSRGGNPRGRGRNTPPNQGARQQPRTSLADIAIDDEDDTEDQPQAQGAEKKQKKPKGKKKSQAEAVAKEPGWGKESSLSDVFGDVFSFVLSKTGVLVPNNSTESINSGQRDGAKEKAAKEKAESNKTRKEKQPQSNKKKNKADECGCGDVDDKDDLGNKTQAQEAEKKKKKPKGKKKSQTQNEESINSETPKPDHPSKTSESSETSAGESGPNIQAVFDFMVKELNGKGSPEEIKTKSGLFPMFDLAMVEQWFQRFFKKFKNIVRDGHVIAVLAYAHELNYCLDYCSRHSCKKDDCQRYHLCKDFLSGNCHFGPQCRRSHNFFDKTSQNLSISKKFGYTKRYNNQQLLTLMQCRYPRVCHEWNQQKACGDPCCPELHMCEKFLQGRCEDGEDCTYVHARMSDHNTPIVEAYAMIKWTEKMFGRIILAQRSVVKREHEAADEVNDDEDDVDDDHDDDVLDTDRPSSGTTVDASKSDEGVDLCDQFLLDSCTNKECPLYHNEKHRLPYLWQVKVGNQWVDCSQSEEIEKEFCALTDKSEPFYVRDSALGISELVAIEFYPTIRAILLDDQANREARRLSTKSFKEKSPGRSDLKTQWRWYHEISQGDVQLFTPDTLQHTLESKFLAGQKQYRFFTPGLPYIDFMKMCLVHSGKYATIHRRPLLMTSSSIAGRKRLPILSPDVSVRVNLPKGWDVWDTNNDMELVKLAKTSLEYEQMEDRFFQHLKRERLIVDGIFRVQNYTLWDQFSSKEHSMKATLQRVKKGASALNKRYLFHGTETFDAVKGICRSNIDPRRAGKNDTMFGEGAYFAAEARLAHQYTLAPDRYVFITNVLVGEYCKGDRSYRIPPAIPDTDLEYDSCVDDVDNPMKYVLFDRNQYYPEYLVWYHDAE